MSNDMINPTVYYTPKEVIDLGQAGHFPVRSRTTLTRLIRSGRISVVNYATQSVRPYYKIKGEELLRFMQYGDVGSHEAARVQGEATDHRGQ